LAPASQVEAFHRDLTSALAEQQRRLASEAIRRVLERGKADSLSQFVQAVQAANVAALVDSLDERIVQVIRKLLAEEQIAVAEGDVIGKFLQLYSSVEEGDIPEAVKAFEVLLREAFKEAKKANKGKKTVRLTLK
jgi:DNA-binding FadR family transcriptional regulator